MNNSTFKCHFCSVCNGRKCISELPGMGGVYSNANFQQNYDDWRSPELQTAAKNAANNNNPLFPVIRLAPMTGGVENAGYHDEVQFYDDLISASYEAGFQLSIGDGTPDIKLQAGINAVRAQQIKDSSLRAAVFIKPYPDEKILERFEWASSVASHLGIDIDSYNIVTMRNLVRLEHKTETQLKALHKQCGAAGVPFMIKGVFTAGDLEMMSQVKPDIIVVSNHGGRVENGRGSTASYLANHYKELRNCCGELWVDGGLRTYTDIQTAACFGVSQVMIGRPVITALCRGGTAQVRELYRELSGKK